MYCATRGTDHAARARFQLRATLQPPLTGLLHGSEGVGEGWGGLAVPAVLEAELELAMTAIVMDS